MNTKLHALCDGQGRLLDMFVTAGPVSDYIGARAKHTRKVLSWRVSNTLEADFRVEALNAAIHRFGLPEFMNTDQGSQFTSFAWKDRLRRTGLRISMNGKGRWVDIVGCALDTFRISTRREWYMLAATNVRMCIVTQDGPHATLSFRAPTSEDGADVWDLIRKSGPLDENSLYCNLLQCDHFADTCVIAELGGEIVGWISAFIPPDSPDTLFVWQVAVGESARGRGVAKKMLADLLARPICVDVKHLKTTITADNDASWALFNSFADNMDAELNHEPHYEEDAHFGGKHATEYMVTISDIDRNAADDAPAPPASPEKGKTNAH